MNNVIRLALVDPNDSTRATLKNLLLGIDMVWLEAEASRYEFFTDVVLQTQPDIALVSLDTDFVKGLALVAKISQDLPNCNVLVASSSQEGSLILQAMRNGAKEFLNLPLRLDDFLAALDRIEQSGAGSSGDGKVRASQLITIGGAQGGVGCTALAVNMACLLAKNEQNSVALVDLNFALGDADVWLDIIPEYTIQDVAENISRLDYSLLKRSLTQHDCGVFLLPRPVQIEDTPPLTPDELRRVVAMLKATFSHLIIDIGKNYSVLDLAAIEISDTTLLVTQLDLPSLRNVVRLLQYFDQREDDITEKIKIVVNRLGLEESQISTSKALETIGREIYWQIPNDYPTMVESRNNGVPLVKQAPKAKLTKCITQLAQEFSDSLITENEDQTSNRKGLFSFLGSVQK
jgi:pilus assembly protein CpaE